MIGVRSVEKRFGSFAALRDVSLEVASGELVALLGPSGSGKTTLLRILAGLEAPDAGSVFLEDADCTSAPAAERRVGFVFQHYALFRHMTVFENVAFGLRVLPRKLRPDKREIERRVKRLLALVRLEGHAEHPPSALSGGQRQRIALARALAIEPRVLLLDEPFGALDARVREELRSWLRRLHDEIRVTTILVTHDQEEAMAVSDRVVVMNEGRIEQIGTPEELERAPSSRFVFEFVGHANVLELPGDTTALGYVRPHDLELSRVTGPGATVEVLVLRVRTSGAVARIELAQSDAGAPALVAEIARERLEALDLRVGERLFAGARRTRVFPKESP